MACHPWVKLDSAFTRGETGRAWSVRFLLAELVTGWRAELQKQTPAAGEKCRSTGGSGQYPRQDSNLWPQVQEFPAARNAGCP